MGGGRPGCLSSLNLCPTLALRTELGFRIQVGAKGCNFIPCKLASKSSGSLTIRNVFSELVSSAVLTMVNRKSASIAMDMLILVIRIMLLVLHCFVQLGLSSKR